MENNKHFVEADLAKPKLILAPALHDQFLVYQGYCPNNRPKYLSDTRELVLGPIASNIGTLSQFTDKTRALICFFVSRKTVLYRTVP